MRPQLRHWVKEHGGDVHFGTDAEAAVKGAECVVSDAWVSMGDEDATKRHNLLKPYQVNAQLMQRAGKDRLHVQKSIMAWCLGKI